MKAYAACIYGMGGSMLDPAGGMRTLMNKIRALGVETSDEPFAEEQIDQDRQTIGKVSSDLLFIVGDSCGANRAPWLADRMRPRKVDYMACIQASIYCNAGCPPIPSSVKECLVIFSDFAHTGGLGVYIPHCAVPPNNYGLTKYRQQFIPAFHPDDQDVARVHTPILADIKRIMS